MADPGNAIEYEQDEDEDYDEDYDYEEEDLTDMFEVRVPAWKKTARTALSWAGWGLSYVPQIVRYGWIPWVVYRGMMYGIPTYELGLARVEWLPVS